MSGATIMNKSSVASHVESSFLIMHYIKLLVSVILIAVAIYILDMHTILVTIRSGSAEAFIIAVILNLLAFFVMGFRWYLIAKPIVRLPLLTHMSVYFKGSFLNTFTPANLGSDAYRLAVFRKDSSTSSKLVKLLLRERIIGLYGYLIVFAIAYILLLFSINFNTPLVGNPYVYGLIVALGFFSLPFSAKRLGIGFSTFTRGIIGGARLPKLESYVETMAGLLSFKGVFPLLLITYFGVLMWVISIKVIAEGFGLSVSLTHLATVATLVEIIRLMPVTIQGIGLREGAFAYLLAFLGYNPEQCYAIGTIAYLALSVAIILSGPIGYAIALCEQSKE